MAIVKVEKVRKRYLLGEQLVDALRDVSLAIEPGAFLAIAGPSGSGKSTLLNIMGCIDNPSEGRVYIEGNDVSGRTSDQLADLRARTIGFIFQSFNLLPVLSAEENVEYPLLHLPELTRAERRERVTHYLDIVGLSRFGRHRPNQLSGGQRQRVAIARAFLKNPAILILDEATSSLDSESEHLIQEALGRLMRGRTTIVIAHRLSTVVEADKIIVLQNGRIVEIGRHEELLRSRGHYAFLARRQFRDTMQPLRALAA